MRRFHCDLGHIDGFPETLKHLGSADVPALRDADHSRIPRPAANLAWVNYLKLLASHSGAQDE